MSDFETHGNGFSGRVDGPLFDARHILMPAAMIFGTFGEALQADAEHLKAIGQATPDVPGFMGWMVNAMATNPLDSKALGLACATAAATQFVQSARTIRDISVENALLAAGIDHEAAVEPVRRRVLKRLGAYAVSGVAAFGAYKVGENFSAQTDLLGTMGVVGGSVAYLEVMKKRMTGRW